MKLLEGIETKIQELHSFPERGIIVHELEKQNIVDYRESLEGTYRILYSVQANQVTVHAIIDARRNFEELLIKKLMHMY